MGFASWDDFFAGMAEYVAGKSKDPSTKVGSVIVGPDNEILSIGFNGFPRKVRDIPSEVLERYERPEKYEWTVHAEANAVANAARTGTSLLGGTLYCTLLPCSSCAALVAQAGITRVVAPAPGDSEVDKRWEESFKRTFEMLSEAEVDVQLVDREDW